MSHPSPVFTQMPWMVKKKIVGLSDPVARISLRKCSQELRNYVINTGYHFEKISLFLAKDYVGISLSSSQEKEDLRVGYSLGDDADGCDLHATIGNKEKFKSVPDFQYMEQAVLDFMCIVMHPDVTISELEIRTDSFSHWRNNEEEVTAFMIELNNALYELPHKLSVDYLNVTLRMDQENFLSILQFVKPKRLQKITTWLIEEHQPMGLVTATEQWMGAKELRMDFWGGGVPVEDFLHFAKISFGGGWLPLSLEELVIMVEEFYQRGDGFEKFYTESLPYDVNAFLEYLASRNDIQHVEPPGDMEMHVRIPNGVKGLNIYASENSLVIYNPVFVKPDMVKAQPLY